MAKSLAKNSTGFPWSVPWFFFPWYKEHPAKKFYTFGSADRPFLLEKGGILPEVTVAYETYGKLNAARDNTILVLHALTGDSHVAQHNENDLEPGWWDELVGPGKLIDTNQYFVICSNVLGGCQGTTGPSSINPATGRPYGGDFPAITITDMVRVQHTLLEHLKIPRLTAVIGGSMGGMQALQWAVSYPDFVDHCIVIAAPGKSSAQSIAYNAVGRHAIMNDPLWQNGHYYHTHGPVAGLGLARMLGMITYQSDLSMEKKFGRNWNAEKDLFDIQSYLYYQADKLVSRFDANSYLCMLDALDHYDLADGWESYEAALGRVQCQVVVVGVSSDILYPAYQLKDLTAALRKAKANAHYLEIQSSHGHDGFLLDLPLLQSKLGPYFHQFTNKAPLTADAKPA